VVSAVDDILMEFRDTPGGKEKWGQLQLYGRFVVCFVEGQINTRIRKGQAVEDGE
jgi:hypothetical protein